MKHKVSIFLSETPDALLGPVLTMDVTVAEETATLADLLAALDEFAAAHIADCRGCDGCCHERAPLIAADIPALNALLSPCPFPAHAVCAAFAQLSIDQNGATDITLQRDADSACCFLDREQKCCRAHAARPFVCRSHFCLPRSSRLEQLRQQIINQGEDELTRLLLAEEAQNTPPLTPLPLASCVNPADYAANGQSGRASYGDIRIRDSVDAALWQELTRA